MLVDRTPSSWAQRAGNPLATVDWSRRPGGRGQPDRCIRALWVTCASYRISVRFCTRRPHSDSDRRPSSTSTASWRCRRWPRKRGAEGRDQRRVQDEGSGNPGPMLWTIALPLHEELAATPHPPLSQDLVDPVRQSSVHQAGLRRRDRW